MARALPTLAPSTWNLASGAFVPMPTLLFKASIERVLESKFRASTALLRVQSMVLLTELILPVVPSILNLDEPVAIPPIKRSSVMFKGDRVPSFLCQ